MSELTGWMDLDPQTLSGEALERAYWESEGYKWHGFDPDSQTVRLELPPMRVINHYDALLGDTQDARAGCFEILAGLSIGTLHGIAHVGFSLRPWAGKKELNTFFSRDIYGQAALQEVIIRA